MLAATTINHCPDEEGRLKFIAQRVLARDWKADEQPILHSSLKELRANYAADPAAAGQLLAVGQSKPPAASDVSELAAWTMLINQVMNLDEALNK